MVVGKPILQIIIPNKFGSVFVVPDKSHNYNHFAEVIAHAVRVASGAHNYMQKGAVDYDPNEEPPMLKLEELRDGLKGNGGNDQLFRDLRG